MSRLFLFINGVLSLKNWVYYFLLIVGAGSYYFLMASVNSSWFNFASQSRSILRIIAIMRLSLGRYEHLTKNFFILFLSIYFSFTSTICLNSYDKSFSIPNLNSYYFLANLISLWISLASSFSMSNGKF
jgi:hypothetical protein